MIQNYYILNTCFSLLNKKIYHGLHKNMKQHNYFLNWW